MCLANRYALTTVKNICCFLWFKPSTHIISDVFENIFIVTLSKNTIDIDDTLTAQNFEKITNETPLLAIITPQCDDDKGAISSLKLLH